MQTALNVLTKIMIPKQSDTLLHPPTEHTTFIYQLMLAIRGMTEVPATFEDLTWKLLNKIPPGNQWVDFVVDSYRNVLLKSTTRMCRGTSSKINDQVCKIKHST